MFFKNSLVAFAMFANFYSLSYAQEPTEFKVMTYNVLLGFHTYPNPQLQKERLESAKRVIQKEDPDILLLQEAFYSVNGPWGDICGNVILSKYPIRDKEILNMGNRKAMRVKIELPSRELLTVDNLHLDPYISEKEKSQQLEQIIKKESNYYILGGDLNSLSPEDKYVKANLLSDFNYYYGANGEYVLDDWLTCDAIKKVFELGLEDANPNKFTYPTKSFLNYKNSEIRIDYLFHSPDLKKIDSWVNTSKDADNASDHYPVISIFRIS